jgi:hypothetical protein
MKLLFSSFAGWNGCWDEKGYFILERRGSRRRLIVHLLIQTFATFVILSTDYSSLRILFGLSVFTKCSFSTSLSLITVREF